MYILYIQQFIHRYPTFYLFISFVLSSHINSYPVLLSWSLSLHLIQPFYPFVSCYLSLFILTFILLVIRSGSRLIRLIVACCLIGPSFAYPAQQQGKPLCFYFPAPRCCGSRFPLLAASAPGPSPQRHRLLLLPAPPPGIGGGGGGGGGELTYFDGHSRNAPFALFSMPGHPWKYYQLWTMSIKIRKPSLALNLSRLQGPQIRLNFLFTIGLCP